MRAKEQADFEHIPLPEGQSFACREFNEPRFTTPWHYHPEIELTYIVDGYGHRFVGDSIEPFDAGDLVLLGSNLPHYWRSMERAAPSGHQAHSRFIQFHPDFLGAGFFRAPELQPVTALLQRAQRGLEFHGSARGAAAAAIEQMRDLPGPERIATLVTVLSELAASTEVRVLSSPGFAPNLDHHAADRISRCHRYIFENIDGKIRLEDAASRAGMGPSAFCRYFRRVTGKTFFDVVNELRIAKACRLLVETEDSITDICYSSGFSSVSNFNRRFRDRRGASPRQYRSQNDRPR
jgi:AraC-like DNA-binding protein